MSSGSKRALVVDDDPSARGFFARLLTLEGYDVAAAADGLQAQSLLEDGAFELVISDINMPGMGGIQLLHAVRAVDLDVPVILITGAPSVETAAKAVELGAMRYLVKPVDVDTLRGVVRSAYRLFELAKIKREVLALHGRPEAASDLAGLTGSFDRALGSLRMAYQPVTRFSTQETWGYEALVRTHESSLPGPVDVLGAADRLGRMHDLGRATRRLVASAIPTLEPDQVVLVNLDPRELEDPELYHSDAPLCGFADRVIIELTERARLEDIARLAERINALRRLGFRFAIDDLGAGYAGLQTFVHLKPEFAKIDMSLIRNIDRDPTKQRIVRSIQNLCAEMDVEVVAEGIESRAERDCVALQGVDLMQGYLFSRPQHEFVSPNESSFGEPSA